MKEAVTLSKCPDGESIGILHMNDEDSKNTFTDNFVESLKEKLEFLQSDRTYKVIILKGLKDVFCAGASKEALMSIKSGDVDVKDLVISELMLNIPIPIIGVMEGAALGGGLVLGACCDIILMNEKKLYGANFTNMGFTPGMGCTKLLLPVFGDLISAEMMYRGRLFKGKTFKGRSLINYILPVDELMPKAIDIALDLDEKPRKTLEILKYSITMNKRQALIEARVHEDFMHKISFNQPEIQKIIEEMYNSKRN